MKTNNLYKSLRIIALTLAIISMIFLICYKVGHCASGGDTPSSQYFVLTDYFPIGGGYGSPFSDADIATIYNNCVSVIPFDSDIPSCDLISIYEYDSQTNILYLNCFSGVSSDTLTFTENVEDAFTTGATGWFQSTSSNYIGRAIVACNLSDFSCSFSRWDRYAVSFNTSYFITALPTGNYGLLLNTFFQGYPIYCIADTMSYNGHVYFRHVDSPSGGHSKGGAIVDVIDSIDAIEDSSELPEVDVVPPINPTTNGFLQKILNGIATLNKSIQGFGLSILDALQGIGQSIENKLTDISDFFSSLKGTTSADVLTAFNDSYIGDGFDDVQSDFRSFQALFDVNPVDHAPTWDIPLTGTVLSPHAFNKITIDFSFYDSIKPLCGKIIVVLLCIAFVLNVFRSIPDILRGSSGDESGGGVS